MEPEGLFPFSQKPISGLCSEPHESSPHPHVSFNIASHPHLVLPSGLFPSDLQWSFMYFSCLHAYCMSHPSRCFIL